MKNWGKTSIFYVLGNFLFVYIIVDDSADFPEPCISHSHKPHYQSGTPDVADNLD